MGGNSKKNSSSSSSSKNAAALAALGDNSAAMVHFLADPVKACTVAGYEVDKLMQGTAAAALQARHLLGLTWLLLGLVRMALDDNKPLVDQLLSCSAKMPQLVAMLLSARKRPRDWKQAEYSSRVCCVLKAAAGVLLVRRQSKSRGRSGTNNGPAVSTLLLQQTATAQQEVCQLLQASLQQQQQQQQGGTQQLAELAACLLDWHVEAHAAWIADAAYFNASDVAATAAFQLHAAELAAVLAQTLQQDSPPHHSQIITRVAYEVNRSASPSDVPIITHSSQQALNGSPAFLQLSVAVLLMHSYMLQTTTTVAADTCSTLASSTSSSSTSQGQQCDDRQALSDSTQQLWQAAGFCPAALPVFAGTLEEAELRSLLSKCKTRLHSGLLDSGPHHLRGFVVAVQAVGICTTELSSRHRKGQEAVVHDSRFTSGSELAGLLQFDELSRQEQQVLLGCAWLLPRVVLQTVLAYGGPGQAVENAAHTAAFVVSSWWLPGLHDAAMAATTAAAAHPKQAASLNGAAPVSVLLQPLLQDWLLLMWRELLLQQQQQPSRSQVYAAAFQQQFLSQDELLSLVRTPCSCSRDGSKQHVANRYTHSLGSSSRRSRSSSSRNVCVAFNCANMYAMGSLMKLLAQCMWVGNPQRVTGPDKAAVTSVWLHNAPAVLLVLETIYRQLLSAHVICGLTTVQRQDSSEAPDAASADSATISGGSSGQGVGDSSSTTSSSSSTYAAAHGAAHLRCTLSEALTFQLHGTMLLPSLFELARLQWPDGTPSAQSEQQKQQQQQAAKLAPYLCSFTASLLKQCRCRTDPEDTCEIANTCAIGAAQNATALKTLMRADPQPQAGEVARLLPQVRALDAPWVVLMALYLRQAAVWLRGWKADATGDPDPGMELLRLHNVISTLCHVQAKLFSLLSLWDWRCGDKGDKTSSSAGVINSQYQQQMMSAAGAADAHGLSQQQQQHLPPPAYGSPSAEVDLREMFADLDRLLKACAKVTLAATTRLSELKQQEAQGTASSSSSSVSKQDADSSSSADTAGGQASSSRSSCSSKNAAVAQAVDAVNTREWCQEFKLCKTPGHCWAGCLATETFGLLPDLLQSVGTALCNKLPVPWLCNNTDCTNMAGASELQLVGGSSCVCGGCRVARYCGRSCQAAHWPQHKPVCRELAAAAAAATAGQAPAPAAAAEVS